MEFLDWILLPLQRYADFDGRSRRSEYWYFFLANFIIAWVLNFIVGIIPFLGFVRYLYSLALLVPAIACAVRRMHDVGKPGITLLFAFIPIIGTIYVIILLATAGTVGDNAYGPDPKQ